MADYTELKDRVKSLPTSPGVYIYKDGQGRVLYVGKAVNLRNRVRSYFQNKGRPSKVITLMAQAEDFEYILTDSEVEALILECNLIKEHRPRYNVRLRDDKQYPYIRVGLKDPWPRPEIRRRIASDGARYFGPFTDSRSVRRTLDLLNRMFPYCTCPNAEGGVKRACLKYHIGRCLGPCVGACTREEYMGVINQVCLFLEGKTGKIVDQLRTRMDEASEELHYERAAFIRDQIISVEKTVERQKVISTAMTDQDVIAFARSDGEAVVEVFFVRQGKLIGHEHFLLEGVHDEDAREIVTSFVTQFYAQAAYIPEEIMLPQAAAEMEIIQSWLRRKRGDQVRLLLPRKTEEKLLMDMVAANASEALDQMRLRWMADRQKTALAVGELARALGLPEALRRIECYDISNTQGTNAVGSMVVFEEGKPKTSDYRRFRIKTVEGSNDFAMLQETLLRRFKRALESTRTREADAEDGDEGPPPSPTDSPWAALPDLVIVDGGKGQLSAALAVRDELGLGDVPMIGLAKEREEIFVPGRSEPIMLPRDSQGLYLVQRIRDEAHRFAITYHRKLRKEGALGSLLDEVPGIGAKRKTALLRHFGSLGAIRKATVEELTEVRGMTIAAARKIKAHM
ncbi:MAG: excinuclease ABC subunit UvrC [Chloroflexota bacterium]